MKHYIVYMNDSNQIHNKPELIVSKCRVLFDSDHKVFKGPTFACGTGFTKLVEDEIHFVIKCQKSRGQNFRDFDEFVSDWKLSKYLKYDITTLSGGWNKFLGLALFTNYKSRNRIYFDLNRHLSDRLIEIFIHNINKQGDGITIYIEYDIRPLLKDNYNMKAIYDLGDSISLTKWAPLYENIMSETNYV